MQEDKLVQALLEQQLYTFYGWWELIVCTFAFVALMAIWWHIGRKQKDFGQVWLALSVLCWALSGGVEVIYANQYLAQQSVMLNGWRSILSLCNSLFILLALPWFRYIPKQIHTVIKSSFWRYIVGLPFLFSIIETISKVVLHDTYDFVSSLDVFYSFLTLIFLGFILWESFAKRRLRILAWLSIICILITFVAQLYKLTDASISQPLFSAIFKTCLIMIFFALALSWVKELSEDVIPLSKQLSLIFNRKRLAQGKFTYMVNLHGIPGVEPDHIPLTPALYELLYTFAKRKLEDGDDWLEIKPKNDNRPGKAYDIKDHNEIKRLMTALLDGLFGKGSWTKNLHEQPLRSSLFEMSEKRERKIRLAIPVENISFLES